MKAVLISIQPKWCEMIASGKKTVEVRKTKPKLETPFKVYIYCTSSNIHECLMQNESGVKLIGACNYKTAIPCGGHIANGKVIGEFVCDSIDQYDYDYCPHPEIGMDYDCGDSWWEISDEDLENACLTYEDFKKYAFWNRVMYGWHISDLVIYDYPRNLSGFYHYCGDDPNCDGCEWHYFSNTECGKEDYCCSPLYGCKHLKRPPQSWCYVEEVRQ